MDILFVLNHLREEKLLAQTAARLSDGISEAEHFNGQVEAFSEAIALVERSLGSSTERIIRSAQALAKDLVQMHKDTAIEIEHWGNALEFVSNFYSVTVDFDLKGNAHGRV